MALMISMFVVFNMCSKAQLRAQRRSWCRATNWSI